MKGRAFIRARLRTSLVYLFVRPVTRRARKSRDYGPSKSPHAAAACYDAVLKNPDRDGWSIGKIAACSFNLTMRALPARVRGCDSKCLQNSLASDLR